MTKRNPVSAPSNIWFDAEQVDDSDLTLEQQYNNTIQSSIINNHIGTGILPEVLEPQILFDSSLVSGLLDSTPVFVQTQPSDNNYGNQLELTLTGSLAAGNRRIKLAVIGLDFNGDLQYETFIFKSNETQVSTKHFVQILVLLFNDFIGAEGYSFNLGGKLIIKEVSPLTLSRSVVMTGQEIEPNIFWRDFYIVPPLTLNSLLASALPYYNIDDLNIYTSELENKTLLANDVTTQIGQKFLATTNNIQKISFLLGVQNTTTPSDLEWTGDLVISVYPLQSDVACITDIAPNLPIEFSPDPIPLAQLSFSYTSLANTGVILDTVAQPVDFIFSNTSLATGNSISSGSYYAVTIKRSGSADKCDILLSAGSDHTENSRITVFTGKLWTDLPDQDLWFKVYTDAAKVSDGQVYDAGNGCSLLKTIEDPTTLAQIDYSLQNIQFTGTDVYKAVVSAVEVDSDPIPDQKTGNPVNSRKQNELQVQLLNTIDVSNLQAASDPLIVGAIVDKNKKFLDTISATISSKLYSATVVDNEIIIKIIEDSSDTVRFDADVSALMYNLINGDLVNSKLYPDISNSLLYYRVADARLCSMMLGDVNGDGIIDEDDLTLLNSYLDYNLNVGLPTTTIVTNISVYTTVENGYETYTNPFVTASGIQFKLINKSTNLVAETDVDGVLVANPTDLRLAQFTSSSVDFTTYTALSDYKLLLITPATNGNYGAFEITGIDTSGVLTIRKVILNSESIQQMLRADIDGDFYVTSNDGYLLQNYIENVPYISTTTPYPGPTNNQYTKIGSRFNVIKLKLELFDDRKDDYTTSGATRADDLHTLPDIFINDGYFAENNFYTNPLNLRFERQLSWEEYLVVSKSRAKFVPSVFTTQSGFIPKDCSLPNIICSGRDDDPDFDNGRVDYFVPDNLILGGEITTKDGYYYKVDFEVGTVVLEIPDGIYGLEKTINIFDDFIASYTDGDGNLTGLTRIGYPAMRFADCTYVESDALSKDQLRLSVAVQSFSPNTNGLSDDGYYGAIVDGKIGVSIDYTTGLLRLNFTNLYQDTVLPTLSTKIQITAYLKKAGFNNQLLYVDYNKLQNMLDLTSTFSGTGVTPSVPTPSTSSRAYYEVVGTGLTLSDLITLTDEDQLVQVDISSNDAVVYLPSGSDVGRKITLCISYDGGSSNVCKVSSDDPIMGGTYVELSPYGSATFEVSTSGYWALTSVIGSYGAG